MVNKPSRVQSIKRRSDFVILIKQGKKIQVCSWLLLSFKANELGYLRVGWTFPKYVGIAVVRNRLRRWGREFVRNLPESFLAQGVDINVVLKRQTPGFYKKLDHKEFNIKMENGFKKIEKLF